MTSPSPRTGNAPAPCSRQPERFITARSQGSQVHPLTTTPVSPIGKYSQRQDVTQEANRARSILLSPETPEGQGPHLGGSPSVNRPPLVLTIPLCQETEPHWAGLTATRCLGRNPGVGRGGVPGAGCSWGHSQNTQAGPGEQISRGPPVPAVSCGVGFSLGWLRAGAPAASQVSQSPSCAALTPCESKTGWKTRGTPSHPAGPRLHNPPRPGQPVQWACL